MKILIDEGYTTSGKQTGIGHQAFNLYKHLAKISNCSITSYSFLKFIPKVIRKFSYIGWTNIHSLFNNYDVIHYQNFNTPAWRGKNKKVVTIHDLGVYRFPETVPFIYVKYNQSLIRHSLHRADLIITPSIFIKNELIDLFGKEYSDKIEPCQNGIRDVFWNQEPDTKFLDENNIKPFTYFFFLGSLTRRKNLRFVIEAFIEAKNEKLITGETKLVLGGSKWWGAGDFVKLLESSKDIITLGYVNDFDIVNLYRYSKAFVFPSIYEGFGMPVIEAMSQNVPIIISDIPTNIELNKLHNNQMIKFELGNSEELISVFSMVDKDFEKIKKDLHYGDISRYHFDEVAKKTLELYKKLQWN